MAVGRTWAVALVGLDGLLVDVEADVSNGTPSFSVIGLADTALAEARQRVRAATTNSGLPFPDVRLTVNLSPADHPKHGSGFDLAIALATQATCGGVIPASLGRCAHIGELGLDGRVRPVAGILPAVLAARRAGVEVIMVPAENADEANLVSDIEVVPVATLAEAARWHGAEIDAAIDDHSSTSNADVTPAVRTAGREALIASASADVPDTRDVSDIVGCDEGVEALTIAAAGGHHLSMLGPPGAGKTMLAERLPGVLPVLDAEAAVEVASIRSLCGERVTAVSSVPPFEAPHHTATTAAIIGGGSRSIRPGAIARAAHGVLFLDEAPEFSRTSLDALRQPLEHGYIVVHRSALSARFPAQFQLVIAANPCPCGNAGSLETACSCTPMMRRRYLGRLSGPLLDRIDLRVRVHRVTAAQLALARDGAMSRASRTSATVRERVAQARGAAAERLAGTGATLNARVDSAVLRSTRLRLAPTVSAPLDRALERGEISMRGYIRTVRVAWTAADLDGATSPGRDHLGLALALRRGH